MRLPLLLLLISAFVSTALAQTYTSYFTGSREDAAGPALGGSCLMGGATENDNAMRWFLRRAGGGDVLVLRASGSDGYNDYLFGELGVQVNSVETLVITSRGASVDPYVLERISRAEAIWFAGGDQHDYVRFWRGTAVDSLINHGIRERKLAVGGTSAGMAILGGHYYSASSGGVRSEEALTDPFRAEVTVDSAAFLSVPYLERVTTDTHYEERDRQGRHLVFLARALTDFRRPAYGIACDEYTAVCIDPAGRARVYGSAPAEDDNAFFLQVNCEVADNFPERIEEGQPLTWDRRAAALKVYHVQGTPDGGNFFDLNGWTEGEGGIWEEWSALDGRLSIVNAQAPACGTTSIEALEGWGFFRMSPNPARNRLRIEAMSDIESRCLLQRQRPIGEGGITQ